MLFLKRLPGQFLTHQSTIYSLIFVLLSVLYVLFRWNIICLNFKSRKHIKLTCKNYELGKAVGSLCSPMCITQSINTINCQPFQPNFRTVFTAEFHQTSIVIKDTLSSVPSLHWYENDVLKYPSEDDFIKTIKAIVKRSLNVTIPQKTAIGLTHLKSYHPKSDTAFRHGEMDNLWTLLHDNEYLLSALYAEKDIFPSLLGTCGPFFAVEYLEPLEQFHSPILTASCSLEDWAKRVRTAILILELLDEISKEFKDLFYLCDVKLSHFGLTSTRNKIKFTDVSGVFSKQTIKTFLNERKCEQDSDCVHYGCASRCLKSKQCSGKVFNTNIQIVCNKIFLGWKMSNRILIPGLLMTHHIPTELAANLRHCANPHFEGDYPAISEEGVRKGLYNILIEIEQSIGSDAFF